MLNAANFQEFLDTVREKYDIVLVDTPPLLVVTDPSIVATRVDGVLLTIRLSKDSRPQAVGQGGLLAALKSLLRRIVSSTPSTRVATMLGSVTTSKGGVSTSTMSYFSRSSQGIPGNWRR